MLYKLEVENFSSIRDQQVLDLTIAPNVPDPEKRFAPIFPGSKLRAPKVIALYGANASGKTTLLKALEFIVLTARDSVQRTVAGFPLERFNDEASCSRPIRLALELGGAMDLSQSVLDRISKGEDVEFGVYRYELEIEVVDGLATRITSEALRQRPNGVGKWQRIFERDGSGAVKDSKIFPLSGFQHLLNTLAPNVSVLSSFAKFQHPAATLFVAETKKMYFQFGSASALNDQYALDFIRSSPTMLTELSKELGRIDVGVEGVRFVESPNGPQVMFKHRGLAVEMPWILESNGTRSFIKMFPLIAVTFEHGGLCAIDEFDMSIHPLVLPEILRWFHDGAVRNPYQAQLWFSCHSASLLEDLTKEEIVICEKDRMGRTRVHSLMDVKIVRRDENHYRKYLGGAYGGVPHIG